MGIPLFPVNNFHEVFCSARVAITR
jgi:hypothetical protein